MGGGFVKYGSPMPQNSVEIHLKYSQALQPSGWSSELVVSLGVAPAELPMHWRQVSCGEMKWSGLNKF